MFAAKIFHGPAMGFARQTPTVLRALSGNPSAIRLLSSKSPLTTPLTPSTGTLLNTSWKTQVAMAQLAKRGFSATLPAAHEHVKPPAPGKELWVTFVDKDGDEHKLAVCAGDNILSIAQTHDIEMEGACEGSCACSTCHVIVQDENMFDKIPEATDDENDMLDLAFGLTETSRLGCQIEMTQELNGLRVKLPNATRNMQASNFAPK